MTNGSRPSILETDILAYFLSNYPRSLTQPDISRHAGFNEKYEDLAFLKEIVNSRRF